MGANNNYKKMYISNYNLTRVSNNKIKMQHNLDYNKTNNKPKTLTSKTCINTIRLIRVKDKTK